MKIATLDITLIHFFRNISIPFARFGLFIVFFWFGILKVIGMSPASGLVQRLFEQTITWVPFHMFLIGFGIFECIIGLMFLIRGLERFVIPLLLIHIITTLGPLVVLPSETWQGFMIPTLEGQYIIKNVLIIASALLVAAHIHPLSKK
jgi:uncharacterized membrane protein YkgB